MLLLIWASLGLTALLLYSWEKLSKLSKAGVSHLPALPFVGNTGWSLIKAENIIYGKEKLYQTYPDDCFLGFYEFLNPLLVIKDIELLKRITVKDFECFTDRRNFTDEPLFRNNLLLLKGAKWKCMRSLLSPAFTSSKMRLMFPLIVEVAQNMVENLTNKINESEINSINIDSKDLFSRYANDVLSYSVFGIKVKSLERRNEFYEYCKELTSFSFVGLIKILIFRTFPGLFKMLNLRLSSKESSDFFAQLFAFIIKKRKEQTVPRHDVIQVLIKAEKEWTDKDLRAQAVILLFAGFETISTTMAFALRELALHPEMQKRLVLEIKENISRNGEKETAVDYDTINRMKYLDMFVSEVLRLWPPATTADRTCTKDYNLGKPNSKATKEYIVRKGDAVEIPIWAIHRDPKFFPDPQNFDPERFSHENKHKIKPFTYLPFGVGPRSCIGSRIAIIELKVGLCLLLQNIEVSTVEGTLNSDKLRSDSIRVILEEGHWVTMKARL